MARLATYIGRYVNGATEEEILSIKDSYNPVKIYNSDKYIKKVIETFTDGIFNDGYEEEEVAEVKDGVEDVIDKNIEKEEKLIEGTFKVLYYELLKGTHWHQLEITK